MTDNDNQSIDNNEDAEHNSATENGNALDDGIVKIEGEEGEHKEVEQKAKSQTRGKKKKGKRKSKSSKKEESNILPLQMTAIQDESLIPDAKKQKIEEQIAVVDTQLYCLCRRPDDGTFMVACDTCPEWYHPICIGIPEVELQAMTKYICVKCSSKTKNKSRKSKGKKKTKQRAQPIQPVQPTTHIEDEEDLLQKKADEIARQLAECQQQLEEVNQKILEQESMKDSNESDEE